MAMLPEEFPVVLTVFYGFGAWRISKKNVLTRKPSAVETLGSATVLCTDKTGTLTQNKMTVTQLYNGSSFFKVNKCTKFPEEFHEIIEYGILSSQTNPFDPMERAITNMGELYLKNTDHIHIDWQMVKGISRYRKTCWPCRVFFRTTINSEKPLQPRALLKLFLIYAIFRMTKKPNMEKPLLNWLRRGCGCLGLPGRLLRMAVFPHSARFRFRVYWSDRFVRSDS